MSNKGSEMQMKQPQLKSDSENCNNDKIPVI